VHLRQDSNAEWTFAEWTFLNGHARRHSAQSTPS
jgi:hypothetical protein